MTSVTRSSPSPLIVVDQSKRIGKPVQVGQKIAVIEVRTAVKNESSGITHGRDRWLALADEVDVSQLGE